MIARLPTLEGSPQGHLEIWALLVLNSRRRDFPLCPMLGGGCDFGYHLALSSLTPSVHPCWVPVSLTCSPWMASEEVLVGGSGNQSSCLESDKDLLDAGWRASSLAVPSPCPRERLGSHVTRGL